MKQLYLVDASIYIFRAYFSLPDTMTDANGNPVNAVYGFADFLARLLAQTDAEYIAVAFDESLTTSFRNDILPAYKENRELPPPELEAQLAACQELSEAMGLASYVSARHEADDLIGTLAYNMRSKGFKMVIVSGDKDLTQLIDDGDIWWDFTRDRRFGPADIKTHFGVMPTQIADLIALMGDKVDNIPGINGIGQKTAVHLLDRFGSLNSIYECLDQVPHLKIRRAAHVHQALKNGKADAYLSQQLADIAVDAPISFDPEQLLRQPADRNRLSALCDELGFGRGMRERLGLAP
ncbi:MAG: exodeoxyribonuclease IX [Gammaproteobacteria bacterium]|nr:exodeoxyribonuclease IX [Gammaproteobacteria bacterium]